MIRAAQIANIEETILQKRVNDVEFIEFHFLTSGNICLKTLSNTVQICASFHIKNNNQDHFKHYYT